MSSLIWDYIDGHQLNIIQPSTLRHPGPSASNSQGVVTSCLRQEDDVIIADETPLLLWTVPSQSHCRSCGYQIEGDPFCESCINTDFRGMYMHRIFERSIKLSRSLTRFHGFCGPGCPQTSSCGFPLSEMVVLTLAYILTNALQSTANGFNQNNQENNETIEYHANIVSHALSQSVGLINELTIPSEGIRGLWKPDGALSQCVFAVREDYAASIREMLSKGNFPLDWADALAAHSTMFIEPMLTEESLMQTADLVLSNSIDIPSADLLSSNTVGLCDPLATGYGIYPLVSRIGHSCVPNCRVTYEQGNSSLTLRATRTIQLGEELSLNHLCFDGDVKFDVDVVGRAELLKVRYGLICTCTACKVELGINHRASDDFEGKRARPIEATRSYKRRR